MNIKILFFGSDYPPTGGGISTYTQEWLFALAKENSINGKVFIFGNREPRKESIMNIFEVNTLRSVNFFYVGYKIFLYVLRNKDFEILHSFNLFPVGFWVIFWSKFFGKKGILTFYGADACDTRTSKKVLFLQRWTIKNAYKNITISEFTKDKVINRYKIVGENINVIYPVLPRFFDKMDKNSKEIKDIINKFKIENNDFIIIAVCRLVKRKGIEYLIDAIRKIGDKNVKVIIIGDGKERVVWENKVKDYDLNNQIFFAGKVPNLVPYYSIANIAVLLSYIILEEGDFEGLGLVLLEAQSYGLPVIGTRSGGIPEAIDEGGTGLVVPEKNSDAIAKAILRLKNDSSLYVNMKEKTKVFLEGRFGKKNTIDKYLNII